MRPTMLLRLATSLLAALVLLLAGCEQLPMAQPPAVSEYRLAAGDVLQVNVSGQPELSGKFTVDASGQISLLQAGAVMLDRKTLREAEVAITEKLRRELRAPVVSVNISQYRPVFVTGEVRNSGGFAYVSGLTVRKAIAMAGGYAPRGSKNSLAIVREGRPKARAMEETEVAPGDTIEVGERLF